ncbi:MAG: MmgE/PrpD family protein, partial [Acidaminococcaceae bacterium]|nr:MmgE/PrpD family protein [Acidaminococcaceae bacterium]
MTTKALAKFTSALKYKKLSGHSVEMAKRCMLDWLGIAIRGSRETPSRIIRETIVEPGGQQATVFSGTGLKANA